MNSNTYTSKIVARINAMVQKNANGVLISNVRLTETKGGNITEQSFTRSIRLFLLSLRNTQRKAKNDVRLLSVVDTVLSQKTPESLFEFVFDSEGKKVVLDNAAKQRRLNAFSRRIINSTMPFLGVEAKEVKDLTLTGTDILRIVQALAGVYSTQTVEYKAPERKPKVVKAAKQSTKPTNKKPAAHAVV